MKLVLSALCMVALIPVAASASETPATKISPQARCLQKAAGARAADNAYQFRMTLLAAENLGAMMPDPSAGSSAKLSLDRLLSRRIVASRVDPSVETSACDLLPDTQQFAAPRTSEPRRLHKAGPR